MRGVGKDKGRAAEARRDMFVRPPPLSGQLAVCSGGGKHVRRRHHVDRGVRAERADGFTPGVPTGAEGGTPGVRTRDPSRSDLGIPPLRLRRVPDPDPWAPTPWYARALP